MAPKLWPNNWIVQIIAIIHMNWNDWPEDMWFMIGDYLDLNLFLFENKRCASLYFAEQNGDTNTDFFISIDMTDFEKELSIDTKISQ